MITACVQLGYALRCSPFEFFDLPESQLYRFIDIAGRALEDMRR